MPTKQEWERTIYLQRQEIDAKDKKIAQLQQQLAEANGPVCERCGDTGRVYYRWREWWGGWHTEKETSPCPDCSEATKPEGGGDRG